ncbi:MAG TPA: efflux RND transporter periplasmic adaptor subunit [Bryobacteraceae bacterium]|nr:efflux RND transporter periplasmic adaptor subunit [Bryobacteraceae bacterium]
MDDSVRKDLNVTLAVAEEAPMGTFVAATGQLQVNEDASWTVGAMTDGKITSVPVRVGDQVRSGQVMAILHSHDVHDARASLRQAKAEVAKQKVLEEQARAVRDRTRRLFQLRAASREQLEAAEAMYLSTTNSVAAAQAEVDKAEFHLTDYLEVALESRVGHKHEAGGDGLTIKSPASGTLMERKATAGTVVSAGDPVFTVADLTSLWFIAAVNEADMSRVRPGQRVNVTVRAFPDRKFAGKVLRLGERLDPQTRTLQVRVLLPNDGGLLKPDMFATADFETSDTRRVLQVPESSVQELNGKHVVFVPAEGDSFSPKEVTIGGKNAGRVQVLSGLRPGDTVVVSGAYLLKTQAMKESGN